MTSRLAAAVIAVLVLGASVAAGCGGERAPGSKAPGGVPPRTVTVALDFAPNPVHAGIYSAVERGEDRARDIALRLRAPSASTDSLKLLTSRRADVSVVDIHDLGLARERGQDFVGVGALVQQPLAAIIARRDVRRPRDLEGRRVGVSGLPSDPAVLRAVVEGDGGDFTKVRQITIGFSAVPNLIQRRVDAVPAFWNAEGVVLKRRRVPVREFRVDDYGAPRYPEVVLFTGRGFFERRRRVVDAVVGALEEGVRDVLRDPEPAVREIARAGNSEPGLVRAQLRAVAPAFAPPLVLRRSALEGWARFDVRFGILHRRPDVEAAFPLAR
jgi:putative hydroxymethylpyrimidine transport system substrate-binding protein